MARSAKPVAFFAARYFTMVGMLNGLAHPPLTVATFGYFPGLATSLLVGIASLWLWLRLRGATRPGAPSI